MKTTYLILLMFFYHQLTTAQNKINIELRYDQIFVSNINAQNSPYPSNNDSGNSLRVLAGYHINNYLNINAGLGLDNYNDDFYGTNTIPIVANIKYSIGGQPKGVFLMLEGGPQIKLSDSFDKGYMFLGAIGYKIKLSRLLRLNFMGGYNFQKSTEGLNIYDDNVSRQGFFIGTSISL